MKSLLTSIVGFFFVFPLAAAPFQFEKYEVLFTNPECKTYDYQTPLRSQSGDRIFSKTPGAYCKGSDSYSSARRSNAPHQRLVDWIRDTKTKEIFMLYLSFSKGSIRKELCKAIKQRGVNVTIVIDRKNEGDTNRMREANELKKCGGTYKVSGHSNIGGPKTGFAHNKLFFVNPFDKENIKIAFSSGNMSSGTVTHHENWHFIEAKADSYFAKAHLCLRKGVLENDQNKRKFSNYITECRKKIDNRVESDIESFFVPGEGNKATQALEKAFQKAKSIDIAAHRFSYSKLIKMIEKALKAKKQVRLIVDDDIYWSRILNREVGRNSRYESSKIRKLERQGLKVHYVETFADDPKEPRSLQLQHNKFLVFHYGKGQGSVFAGAGNLTTAAFTTNFENFYLIEVDSVYQQFVDQYKLMWGELSKDYKDMPTEYVLP